MDKLLIIPIVLAALYFMYRYVRKSIKREGGCNGNYAACSRELMKKTHGNTLL